MNDELRDFVHGLMNNMVEDIIDKLYDGELDVDDKMVDMTIYTLVNNPILFKFLKTIIIQYNLDYEKELLNFINDIQGRYEVAEMRKDIEL